MKYFLILIKIQRLEDKYESQIKTHHRELNVVQDKSQRLDSRLQIAIKEKHSTASQFVSKDHEMAELLTAHTHLKTKV